MATILTKAIITNALQEVDSYIASANTLYENLQAVIAALTTANFSGDASDGYKVFFDSKVTPALTENLTAPNSSLTAGIKSILQTIQSQLLDTVDPELGNTNRDPSGGAGDDSVVSHLTRAIDLKDLRDIPVVPSPAPRPGGIDPELVRSAFDEAVNAYSGN